jgi:hypothetical protein
VSSAANHWVYQEVLEVRAVSNVCTIGQDWDRISPGLAGCAIAQGWWPGDGTKLDFASALSDRPTGEASALRRWGRATLLLEQQNGHIDGLFLRRLLSDHYEGTYSEVDPFTASVGPVPLCRHAHHGTGGAATAASLFTRLTRDAERLLAAECAFGPPCLGVFFPVFLDGELPFALTGGGFATEMPNLGWRLRKAGALLGSGPDQEARVRERLARLQYELDQEAEEFAASGAALKRRGEHARLQHSATELMRLFVQQFDAALAEFDPPRLDRRAHVAPLANTGG